MSIHWSNVIVIEGPDGSGKTTQSTLLERRLGRAGYDVTRVQPVYELLDSLPFEFEPTTTPREQRHADQQRSIRSLVLKPLGLTYAVCATLFLMVAYRNSILVCDRYFYQYFFDLVGEYGVVVSQLFPTPALTILLLGDQSVLRERMDEFDRSAERAYHDAVREFYETLARELDPVCIDATDDPESINDEIFETVEHHVLADA